MFIAHVPSGYILAKFLEKKLKATGLSKKTFFALLMVGAVFPDLDSFYFYFIDGRSVHHHKYFVHWFSVWLPILFAAVLYLKITKFSSKMAWMISLFSVGAVLHICLDTFVGDVWLFAPFIDQPYVFFEVMPRYQPWWLNFILHWSFLLELFIVFFSVFIFRRNRTAAG